MSNEMTNQSQYVTAFFDDRSDADRAVERLVDAGVARDSIRFVAGDRTAYDAGTGRTENRGFFEAIGDFFMPDEDRETYAEGLNRGGFLVSLNTTAANNTRVIEILDAEGTVDMDARENEWRSEGWTGESVAQASDASLTSGAVDRSAVADRDGTIKVMEEKLRVGKRDVSQGQVRVRSYIVEDNVSEDVTLRSENVEIVRTKVDRAATGADGLVDRTLELEETSQEAVVSKEARVVEEIALKRHETDRTETVSDTVRHTEVEIEDGRVENDLTKRKPVI